MRTLMIASIIVSGGLGIAAPLTAQRLDDRSVAMAPGSTVATWGSNAGQAGPAMPAAPRIQPVPVPPSRVPATGWTGAPPMATPPVAPPPVASTPHGGPRWGGRIGGRWWAGVQAPGGWHAYRRPGRGFTLPGYWISPSFFIDDFASFGLGAPPYGYRWVRYYDDAVLVNDSGEVLDSVSGIDWDRGDAYGYGYGYGTPDRGYDGGYAQDGWSGRRDGPGAGYDVPPPPPGPIIERHAGIAGYTQQFVAGGGYVSGSYWYPPVTTTTITIGAPVVTTTTTTTTDYYETRSYRRVRRHVYHAPRRHVVRRCTCSCGCR